MQIFSYINSANNTKSGLSNRQGLINACWVNVRLESTLKDRGERIAPWPSPCSPLCRGATYSPRPTLPLSWLFSRFSLLKRWGNVAGWAYKRSLGKNLEPDANRLKNYSLTWKEVGRENKETPSWFVSPGAGIPALPALPWSSLMVSISCSSGYWSKCLPPLALTCNL